MGIFIHIAISSSVKKKEWKKVYEESLQLVKAFPLAEKRKVKCKGIDTICLVPTKEHEETYGWYKEKTRIGWNAVGDYETMRTAEDYYLPRDLIEENEVEPDAGDAMLGAFPAYLDYSWDDDKVSHTYELWGNKTQGEPYHMYLLAIACMIEARLGKKAFVYGDITRGQCRKAVELANKYLRNPIDIPDRCDMERLLKRVSKLPISKGEQLKVFNCFYLGTRDAEFGEFIRNRYPEEVCDIYWKERFEDSLIGTVGFNEKINEYLLWGFSLEKLCSLVNYNDKNGVPQYEKFIKRIMDAKLHLKMKNCDDILKIDQEESHPYSIYTLMAQFAFTGAENKKVDRYIPIDEVRRALKNGLNEKCNVDMIIDKYLEKESEELPIDVFKDGMSEENLEMACNQDASEVFQQIMEKKRQVIIEEKEKYDIADYDELVYYKKGDTVRPGIMESLGKSYNFYHSLIHEDEYIKLMKKSADRRCEWLIEQNRSILIRDKDWNKIFTDIQKCEQAFERYYPIMRVKISSEGLLNMVKAFVLNDELYAYCKELADIYKDK